MLVVRIPLTRSLNKKFVRSVSTLKQNPHIYVHEDVHASSYTFSLLPTTPRSPKTIVGFCNSNPPTPSKFRESPEFNKVLHATLASHCSSDPAVRAQAAAFASPGGLSLGGDGFSRSSTNKARDGLKAGGDGGGGASSQGGAGGAGVGGWCHISDLRNPPDFGRIAWPEDIFGSVEVTGEGKIDGDGHYQESGTYRVCTNEGILGLTPFMREKLIEKLKQIEAAETP